MATAGGGAGAAILTRGTQIGSTQGQRLLTAAQGVIKRFNIDQILRPERMDHIFKASHMKELLGTRMEAINKVVLKIFEIDASGGLSRGSLEFSTKIDGLRVQITGFIDALGKLSVSNFWVVQ